MRGAWRCADSVKRSGARHGGLITGIVLPTLLSLTSCGGLKDRTSAPNAGTVVYHTPATSRGSFASTRRNYSSTTMIVTTAGEGLEADPDHHFNVSVGERESRESVPRNMTQIATGTKAAIPRVVDPRKFAELWRQLETAGLFRLPRYQSSRPPTDENYIMVKTGSKVWIYTRPRPSSRSQEDVEDATRLLKCWWASGLAIVNFVNSS